MNLKASLLILLSLLSLGKGDNFTCPFVDDLGDCKCFPHTALLECIKESGKPFTKPDFSQTRFKSTFEQIIIKGFEDAKDLYGVSTPSSISTKALSLIDSTYDILAKLTAIKNKVKTVVLDNVSNLNNLDDFADSWDILENLIINSTSLNSLSKEMHIPNLRQLDLRNNQITEITTTAFSQLSNLNILNLKKNKLEQLSQNCFKFNSQNRLTLILEMNQVNNANLKTSGLSNKGDMIVYLANNKIDELDESFYQFCKTTNDYKLFFEENTIKCDLDIIKWLFKGDTKTQCQDHLYHVICQNFDTDIFSINSEEFEATKTCQDNHKNNINFIGNKYDDDHCAMVCNLKQGGPKKENINDGNACTKHNDGICFNGTCNVQPDANQACASVVPIKDKLNATGSEWITTDKEHCTAMCNLKQGGLTKENVNDGISCAQTIDKKCQGGKCVTPTITPTEADNVCHKVDAIKDDLKDTGSKYVDTDLDHCTATCLHKDGKTSNENVREGEDCADQKNKKCQGGKCVTPTITPTDAIISYL